MAWWQRLKRWRLDEDDFAEEIRAHLAIAADERKAAGADPDSAKFASLKEFGNVTLTTEAARRVWTPRWIEALHDLWSDVLYAFRALRKNPVFTLTVVGVLALGIGLNAAVFTMLKGMAFSPIAGVDRSGSLSVIYAETGAGRQLRLSYPDYQYLRDHDRTFSGLFGSSPFMPNLGRGRTGRQAWGELVSGNYFQILGVRAALGRTLLPSDEVAIGGHPVVVISHALWRRDFSAAPDIVGKTIEVNNVALTVVGVADASFHGTTVVYDAEVFVPIVMAPQLGFAFGSQQTTAAGILGDRRAAVFYPQGYLRPGTSMADAAAQLDALSASMASERALGDADQRLRVVPFWRMPQGAPIIVLPMLMVISAMGLFVLLIACGNIAGLVLVRAVSRGGEIAVRLALGATRVRIVRLLIVENLVLALPGAVAGVLLAQQGIPVLVDYVETLAAPQRVFLNIGVDGLVVAFAVLVACASALVFGFMPAWHSSRVDLVTMINQDASPRGAARGRFRSGLVIAQVAVSLVLLVGATLATRSVDAARRANPGFDSSQVTAVTVDVKQNAYDEARGRVFYRQLLDAARTGAGIESATLAAVTPLGFLDTPSRKVTVEGYEPRRGEDLTFMFNTIGPDYFRTLRIAVRAGREFSDRDDQTVAPIVMVNETMASRYWGSAEQAVGKRIRVGDSDWRTVVGVAADVKYARINESPRPYFYLPFLQSYRSAMTLQTRGHGPVDALVDQARARVAALDAELPIVKAVPMAEATRGAMMLFDMTAAMLFVFGAAGMALVAMGTYGLVSYTVKQRTREIGIRLALGATGISVLRNLLGRGLRLGLFGAALGVAAAVGAGRLLASASLLFGVSATDAGAFGRALSLVLGVVLIATLVPSWRAARTNPLHALRHQ